MIQKFAVVTVQEELDKRKITQQIKGLLKKMPRVEINGKEILISFDEDKTDNEVRQAVKILLAGEKIVHVLIFDNEYRLTNYLFYR